MLEQCITPYLHLKDENKPIFNQTYIFSGKRQFDIQKETQWCPDLVDFVSNINDGAYHFTGRQLKNIIIRSFMGDFGKISMEYNSLANNNSNTDYITAGDAMNGLTKMEQISSKQHEADDKIKRLTDWIQTNKILTSNLPEILEYLNAHQDLIDDIIYPVLKDALPKFDQLSLELSHETNTPYPIAIVRQYEYTDTILGEIENIQRKYSKTLHDKSGWFLFTTDFDEPR